MTDVTPPTTGSVVPPPDAAAPGNGRPNNRRNYNRSNNSNSNDRNRGTKLEQSSQVLSRISKH